MSKAVKTRQQLKQSNKWWEQKTTPAGAISSQKKMLQTVSFKLGSFNDQDRTFTAIASTPVVDRQGDVIDQTGWDLSAFMANPVIPWTHDYGEPPVARAIEVGVDNDGYLKFVYQAPPEGMNEFADLIWDYYRNQFMFAFSVGFIPKQQDGNTFTECELLEISAVVVPANPQALALAYKMGVGDRKSVKGLVTKMKASTKMLEEVLAFEKKSTNKADLATEGAIMKTIKTSKLAEKLKGAVADELADEEAFEAKMEAMSKVWDIWWAFIDVFYDQDTPATDLPKLLAETCQLLQALSGDTTEEKSLTSTSNSGEDKDMKTPSQKAGAEISATNKEKIKAVHDYLKGVVSDMGEHMTTLEGMFAPDSASSEDDTKGTDEKVIDQKGEDKAEAKGGEAKSEDNSQSDGADHEEKGITLEDEVDPDNLTEDQAELIASEVNKELGLTKEEESDQDNE